MADHGCAEGSLASALGSPDENITMDSLNQARILVIGDQVTGVQFLEALLELHGFTNVVSSCDPSAASRWFDEVRPDLIVLDLVMSEMHGLGVLQQLRP